VVVEMPAVRVIGLLNGVLRGIEMFVAPEQVPPSVDMLHSQPSPTEVFTLKWSDEHDVIPQLPLVQPHALTDCAPGY